MPTQGAVPAIRTPATYAAPRPQPESSEESPVTLNPSAVQPLSRICGSHTACISLRSAVGVGIDQGRRLAILDAWFNPCDTLW